MIGTVFFVVSKIVGLMLLVESWLVLGMAIGLICLWGGRLMAARILFGGTLLLLLAVLSPLTDIALYQLEKAYPVNPVLSGVEPIHGIISLGGSTIPHNTDVWQQTEINEAGERITETMRLATKLPKVKVLLTGGSATPVNMLIKQKVRSEAEMTGDLMVDMGLDRTRLMLETKARNTAENATLSAALVGMDTKRRWILVTSAFHMSRAMQSFQKAGFVDLLAYPVDHRTDPANFVSDWYPAGKINRANTTIKELVGLVIYSLTGR